MTASSVADTCRSCGSTAIEVFLSLGELPLADALVTRDELDGPEERFALDVAFCPDCSLVQIVNEVPPEKLFVDNYLYFSSFSDHLLAHSRDNALGLIRSRHLGADSLVVEVASNDGYLLRNFVEAGVPVLGIDPAPDQAAAAIDNGVPTITEFFGPELARRLVTEGRTADVIIANNVMAHVPDLNGFVEGFAILLGDDGVVSVENPYVRDLIDHAEFDTIYHEHHCYFSCSAVDVLMSRHGLHLNDVEYFPNLHGGTLRWTIGRRAQRTQRCEEYLDAERRDGLTEFGYYRDFARRVEQNRDELLTLLRQLRADGKSIAGYGAAAKGATLVNYVGIGTDLVDFVVDRNVHKQGRFMPGTHQEILDPSALLERRPDVVLLLAWNFADEIVRQQVEYQAQGGSFIVPVPRPRVL
ncbi:MAG: methyltransferase domain-containing protein [Acidimicrobiales bacterium]|nr:methyltransferase domain-containing protein [Acidimicrobiales bacterium]